MADPAMPEHVGMIGAILIEAGHVDAQLSEGSFDGGLAALDVLSIKEVRLTTDSLAQAALANALVGNVIQSDAMGLTALRESREKFKPTVRCDTICALARSWTIHERWEPPQVEALRQAFQLMHIWGDEPRKARVGALLGRFLITRGELDEARRVLVDCEGIVNRLNLAVIGNDIQAAVGRLYLAEGRVDKALRALTSACTQQEKSQHLLRLAENLLPLGEAAFAVGDADTFQRSQKAFDSLLPLMPGMELPWTASQVRMACSLGAWDDARKLVTRLRDVQGQWDMHPWAGALADRLDDAIARSAGSGPPAH
jgi:hypothetical protein